MAEREGPASRQLNVIEAACYLSTAVILANCDNTKLLKSFTQNDLSLFVIQPNKSILQRMKHDLLLHSKVDLELRDCVLGGGHRNVVWYEYNDSRFDGLTPLKILGSSYPNLRLIGEHARTTHSLDELVIPWIKSAEGLPRRNVALILGLSNLGHGFHLSDDILASGIDQVFLSQAPCVHAHGAHHENLLTHKEQLEDILKKNWFSLTELDDYGMSLWRRDWHSRAKHLEAERDQLIAERDDFRAHRDQLAEERDQARLERDQASEERDGFRAHRDQLAEERDQARLERDQASEERDGFRAHRDQLAEERDQARLERDQASEEREVLNERLDEQSSQYNVLKAKVESSEKYLACLKDLFVQINLAQASESHRDNA